ncbi:hypothetical protein ABG067_008104, partial [Albugo candida]
DYELINFVFSMAHSFVINIKDSDLKARYGDYWKQITSENNKPLPTIPDHLLGHLEKIASLKTYEGIDHLDNYSYYEQKDLPKVLENDILVNIWNIVDQMINSYDLVAKSKSGMELGCGEAGLEAEDFDTK